MFRTVEIPLWLLVVILLFAAVTFASHFLFPSVRWFFRRRAERVIARVNTRLQRPIQPFKLARRYDMIQRLIYDPAVTEAIVEHARKEGVPENVAFETAKRYAREIVPAFSATAYYTFGIRLARWLSRSLYRIRLGTFDRSVLDDIDPDATVIFVMNHRSNMDYVLVTWLVSETSPLSYAVGEWARVWPLSGMIRAMGAYFIRRKSRGNLYRKVLARYVQMATRGGVTQAIFPEGGLSLTGRTAPARLGLISYIFEDHDPGARDVIFVPVALNYDRVLEDRILIRAGQAGNRRFRPPIVKALFGLLRYFVRWILRLTKPYGTASVGFGTPLSLSDFEGDVEALAATLMDRIEAVVPILPVPLVSHLLLEEGPVSETALIARVGEMIERFEGTGVVLPRREPRRVADDALRILAERKLIQRGETLSVVAGEEPVLAYYANSIRHHLGADAAVAMPNSASAKQ